jgi:hypothetical protein
MTNAVRATCLQLWPCPLSPAAAEAIPAHRTPPTRPRPPPPPPPPPPAGPAAPPTFTSPSAISIRENVIGAIYRPVATDANNDAVTYGATIGGPDAGALRDEPGDARNPLRRRAEFRSPSRCRRQQCLRYQLHSVRRHATTTQNVAVTVTNVANGFRVRRVASGLAAPIYAAGLPDGSGRVVIVERAGDHPRAEPIDRHVSKRTTFSTSHDAGQHRWRKGLAVDCVLTELRDATGPSICTSIRPARASPRSGNTR